MARADQVALAGVRGATTGTRRRTHRYPPISAFAVEDMDAAAALRARGAEFVGELERYHDSYRLCDVRGPRA